MLYSYRIEQAIRAATILHKDQVRKGAAPLPYISHLMATTMIVMDYSADENTVIAALLHDTLEDTDYTAAELQEDFGGYVREIVETLTEPQDTKDRRYSWQERKEIYTKQIQKGTAEAAIVSAADKIHNFRSIVEDYYDDHPRFIADFGGSLDKRITVYDKLHDALAEKLGDHGIMNEFNHVYEEYKKFVKGIKQEEEEIF